MSSKKSKWIIFTAAIACIGCCAVPLYLLIAGASSLGVLTALMNKQNLEVLICLAPLVLIAGYFMCKRHQAKQACCAAPTGECSSTQCDSNR
jgi:hypothetical protein